MNEVVLGQLLVKSFPHNPTAEQETALYKIAQFIAQPDPHGLFLLNGFAGTGKTTIISTLVSVLNQVRSKTILLAPTGRAAKVVSGYSQKEAFTIHKKIYYPKSQKGGGVQFTLQQNKHRNTLFIVDESSMIGDTAVDSKLFENGSLLDDLFQYVYSGYQCKIMLVGDTAQLPPVRMDLSPALDPDYLSKHYDKHITQVILTEVMRQKEASGILENATRLRQCIESQMYEAFKFRLQGFTDILHPQDGEELLDAINTAYQRDGKDEAVIILRSNKRANLYNQSIRSRILWQENELAAGDYLMVVKNNYFWIPPTSEAGFIANGDIIEVLQLFSFHELYGFRFAEVQVRLVDYPNMKPFDTILLLDTLASESPSLSYEDSNRLYQEVVKDYENVTSKYKRFLSVKNNRYFNALQVKFSYAITCHKSQGGQWNTVFIEQPYLPQGMDKEYLRWLYTAVTRAREKLYLIGFKDSFFE